MMVGRNTVTQGAPEHPTKSPIPLTLEFQLLCFITQIVTKKSFIQNYQVNYNCRISLGWKGVPDPDTTSWILLKILKISG